MIKNYLKKLQLNRLRAFMAVLAPYYHGNFDLFYLENITLTYFKKILSDSDYKKLSYYYGFDSWNIFPKIFRNFIKKDYINCLLKSLRTIQNASVYIPSYTIIKTIIAKNVINFPDDLDETVKVKIFRLYFYILDSNRGYLNNTNSKDYIYPEELIDLYYKVDLVYKGDFLVQYDVVLNELNLLNQETLTELLDFAELNLPSDYNKEVGFTKSSVLLSRNVAFNQDKQKLYYFNSFFYRPVSPYEKNMNYFCIKRKSTHIDFLDIYRDYKNYLYVKSCVDSNKHCKEFSDANSKYFEHILNFINFYTENKLSLPAKIELKNSDGTFSSIEIFIDLHKFFRVLNVMLEKNYASNNTSAEDDLDKYLAFMEKDISIDSTKILSSPKEPSFSKAAIAERLSAICKKNRSD